MKKSRLAFKSEVSFRSINQSPTNNSISKQTHSFGKSPRFQSFKTECPLISYFGQQMKSRRSGAGIGIGKKSDFTKDLTCSPPPSKYDIKTNFEMNKDLKKGCSIRSSRNQIQFGSYIDKQKAKTPTANQYNIQKSINKFKSPLFSMGSRTKILDKSMTIDALNDNPGPGDYKNPEINNKSTKILGGSLKINFSASKSKRFPSADNRIPGPATYEDVSKLSNVGKYIVSKYDGRAVGKFLMGKRITQFDTAAKNSMHTPGAGSYLLPSQFGYLNVNDRLQTILVPSYQRVKTQN